MKKIWLGIFLFSLSSMALAASTPIINMQNTALQSEINSVEEVNFDAALKMAQKIWSKKQDVVYHSANGADWQGKQVYKLISNALARENQRLANTKEQTDSSLIVPLTQMLVQLQNTTNPDQDIKEARLLFSQALMLEEIRLYKLNSH